MKRASDMGIEKPNVSVATITGQRRSMLEHNAEVIAATPDSVLIETERRAACGHCSVGDRCGTSVIAGLFGRRANQIRMDNSMELQIGDKVVIGIPEHVLLRAAAWAYMVPMLFMLAFASIAATAGHADLYVFIASVAGLFIGLYLAGVIQTRKMFDEIVLLRKHTPAPATVKVNLTTEVVKDE